MPKNKAHGLRKGLSARMSITVRCEWGLCREEFTVMDKYTAHVTQHLERLLLSSNIQPSDNGDSEPEDFRCVWEGCLQDMSRGFIDLVRHVYFHAFHAKLKSYGRTIIDLNELGECRLEGSSRNMIPELPDRLQCVWTGCSVISDNPDFFYQHVTSHIHLYADGNALNEPASCLWEGCEMKTKNKYKLREHLRSHTQEKVIACPTCGGLFANTTKMFDHLQRQIQPTVQTYQCSHCNKRCPTERLLRDHMRHHVNHYKCPFCDMTCPNPSGLRAHIKYRHSTEKPYACSQCSYGGKTMADLRRHSVIHTADPAAFSCNVEFCSFTGTSYFALTVHFRREHQGVTAAKYQCHLCSQSFTRGTSLTKHLKKSHKFKWPSGHKRFRYKLNDDGEYRLQTVRYESIELTQQLLSDKIGATDVISSTDVQPVDDDENDEQDGDVPPSDSLPMQDPTLESRGATGAHESAAAVTEESDLCYNLEMLGEVAMKLPKGRFCRQLEKQERKRQRGDDDVPEDGMSSVAQDGSDIENEPEESIGKVPFVQYLESERGPAECSERGAYPLTNLGYLGPERHKEFSAVGVEGSSARTYLQYDTGNGGEARPVSMDLQYSSRDSAVTLSRTDLPYDSMADAVKPTLQYSTGVNGGVAAQTVMLYDSINSDETMHSKESSITQPTLQFSTNETEMTSSTQPILPYNPSMSNAAVASLSSTQYNIPTISQPVLQCTSAASNMQGPVQPTAQFDSNGTEITASFPKALTLLRLRNPFTDGPLDLRASHQGMPPMYGPTVRSVDDATCQLSSPRKLYRIGIDNSQNSVPSSFVYQLPESVDETADLFEAVGS